MNDETDDTSANTGGFGDKLLHNVRGKDGRPVPYRCPQGYKVDHSGVWAVKETKDGEVQTRVAYAPLIVSAVHVDPDGDQTIELAWLDRGKVVKRIVPRSVAKRGRLLVATLGDAGLPIIEADSKLVERYLASLESINRSAIPQFFLARQLGWQKDGAFVTSQDTPYRVEVRFEQQQKAALAAHRPNGTFEGWQAAIKRLESYPAAQMALYASFAAALLELLDIDSFTVDISGPSTRGKTTSAKCGMSVWADPSEKADGLYSWRTSPYAAELRLNLVNGLPVVFDETKLVKSPELVHSLIYQLGKNHGQSRGGEWGSGLSWRTILISTGEQSVLTFTTDQGAAARVLQVKGAPFGNEGPESAAAAVEARDGCYENFGVAGPRFISALQLLLAEAGGKAKLSARHAELVEGYRGPSDLSARRAPMVAALVLAAELVHAWGIVPFASPEKAVWTKLFAASDQTDNRGEMALDVVREYVASNEKALWSPFSAEDAPFSGWIGRRLQVDKKDTVALLPERLKEALKKAGYELESVIPRWVENGVLQQNPSQRPPYLLGKSLSGSKVRMYTFMPEAFNVAGDDGE